MTRLYEPAAYGPQGACYWADTTPADTWPTLDAPTRADVAIVGGGFTGLSAALSLAQSGVDVAVLEADHPAWGASGRNGGFCCIGGALATDAMLCRRFSQTGLDDWHATERAAIGTVDALIADHAMQVDRHSDGETQLAHSKRAWATMQRDAEAAHARYGQTPRVIHADDLHQHGLGGSWHGAVTAPLGFALNPRKFHSALATAAQSAGARLFAHSPVTGLTRQGSTWHVQTDQGAVKADTVILATNGYSSDDLPDWMRARYLPVLSNIIVTRPLTPTEQEAQGWTSAQMAYDSRTLLHYFRRLPNGRFLFGMRGGLSATAKASAAVSRQIRRDFATLFPAWKDVDVTHEWSGLACIMANLTPFAGSVPGHSGLFAGMGYHGNGVAMGTQTGRLLANHILRTGDAIPNVMQAPPARFPLGRYRRALLRPSYWAAQLLDI